MDEEEEVTLNLAGDGDAGAGGALAALFAPPPPARKQPPAAKPKPAAPAPAAAAPAHAGASGAAGKPAPPPAAAAAASRLGVSAGGNDKQLAAPTTASSGAAPVSASGGAGGSSAGWPKDRVRVPLLYPSAATGGSDAAAVAAVAAVSASTRPQNTLDPAVAAAKQVAARAAIRDALGVAPAAPTAAPAAHHAASTVGAADGKPAHRGGAAASAPAVDAGAGHPPAAKAAAAVAPAKAAPPTSSVTAAAAATSTAAAAPAADAAAAAAARLVPPSADDDVNAWLSCDDFGSLGLEPRLVAKLTAAKQAAGGVGGVMLGAGAPLDDAAGTAVSRGHTRDGFGLSRPTRVQRLFVPPALAGRSLCAKSETGSGKTLAFLAPIVHDLLTRQQKQGGGGGGGMSRSSGLFALVLAPTRELCQQIFTVASRLLQPFPFLVPGLVAGGEKRKAEKARLRKGVSLLVATPGRLCDHLRTTAALVGPSGLASTQWLVLDEADRLLDMGFGPQIAEVVAAMRRARGGVPAAAGASRGKSGGISSGWTTYLLSATLSSRVRTLAASVLADGDTATLLDATALAGGGAGAPPPWMTASPMDEDDDSDGDGDGSGGGDKEKAAAAAAAEKEKGAGKRDRDRDRGDKGAPRDLVTPSRLTQQYVVGALKWRLPTLLALLVDAVALARKGRKQQAQAAAQGAAAGGAAPAAAAGGGVKLMLFMATCEGVDLHAALLGALLPGMLAAAPQSSASAGASTSPPPPPTVRVLRLHGDLPQGQRTAAVRAFASPAGGHSAVSVLVTTDVAARGLDLPSVDAILQADPPSDTQDYVHRVGRTARAGASGRALLLLQPHEAPYVELLAAAGLALHRSDPAPAFAALARCPVPAAMLGGGGGGSGGAKDDAAAESAKGGARKSQPAAAAGHKRKRPADADEGSDADSSDSDADEDGGGGGGDKGRNRRPSSSAPASSAGGGSGGGGGSGSSSMARKLASLMEAAERARAVHSRTTAVPSGGAVASSSSSSSGSSSRWAELQAVLWQTLIEGIVATHVWAPATGAVLSASAAAAAAATPQPTPPEPLVDLARRAFASFVRAYATHEKATRHIFHPRALHLGHAAKACGLTEQPTQVVARSAKAAAKRARVEGATGGGGGGGDKEAAASSSSSSSSAAHAGDGAKGKGGKKQGGKGKGGGKPAGAAAAPPPASKPGSSHNRLSWKPPRAGGGGGARDRDGDRDGPSSSGGGDPGTIKTQLLSKARQVEGRKARMSEFEA
jgi:ATP-dependent RNA helicase DDX31/DBP7